VFKEEKHNKLESTQLACRTFLVRVAQCANTRKVVDSVNACPIVLTRSRVAIVYVCQVNHIIVSNIVGYVNS